MSQTSGRLAEIVGLVKGFEEGQTQARAESEKFLFVIML